jgi:hypothetical protein
MLPRTGNDFINGHHVPRIFTDVPGVFLIGAQPDIRQQPSLPLIAAISAQGRRCTHVSGPEYSTVHIDRLPLGITGIAAGNELFYSNQHGFSTGVVQGAWLLNAGLHVILALLNLGPSLGRRRIPRPDPGCFRKPGSTSFPFWGMPRVSPLHPGLLSCHLRVVQGTLAAPWAALPPSSDGTGCCHYTLGQISRPLILAQGIPTAPWAYLASAVVLCHSWVSVSAAPLSTCICGPGPAATIAHACLMMSGPSLRCTPTLYMATLCTPGPRTSTSKNLVLCALAAYAPVVRVQLWWQENVFLAPFPKPCCCNCQPFSWCCLLHAQNRHAAEPLFNARSMTVGARSRSPVRGGGMFAGVGG